MKNQTEVRSGQGRRVAVRWTRSLLFPVNIAHARPSRSRVLLALAVALLGAGCAPIGVQQQRLVARANMQFGESGIFLYHTARLLPQLESGTASTGGAGSAGCTSCR